MPLQGPQDPQDFDVDHYKTRMGRYLEGQQQKIVFTEALHFAHTLHAGQRRKSGAPYISHPCAVAEILARELQIRDPILLAGALLHDVVEDVVDITLEQVEDRFGQGVAELVDGCTKLTRHHLDRATLKDLTHSKIFLSASRRMGVLIIKLADRLHNLRTLHFLSLAKRQHIAHETVEVYAPIAAKFNIFPMKRELYHHALSYLYPRKSRKILQFIREFRNSPQVVAIDNRLQELFSSTACTATVRARAKGLGTYYDPVKRSLDLANAENHVDFAIILPSEDLLGCYNALGLVNTTFPPIPRSIRDFIAVPKTNGYRSLHVRAHVGGEDYLIKIRTPEMDLWATYGILTDRENQSSISDEHWLEISELLRTIGEYGGAAPQRKALIRLSESEEIFTYSPKGDTYYLPKGSIVLDFAYKIHSELGDGCVGGFINGEWAPPTTKLKDADCVEILTSSEIPEIDPDLEELCRTPKARTAINKQLQQKRRDCAREIGRQILEQEIVRHGLPLEILDGESTTLILEFLNMKDLSELFTRIGQDLISPHLVLYYFGTAPVLRDRASHPQDPMAWAPYEHNILNVQEPDKAMHKFARCCSPYPGQRTLVAILSERGVTFHTRECKDLLQRHDLEPQQLLDVKWDYETPWRHPLHFHLVVSQETPVSISHTLAGLPKDLLITRMETQRSKHDQPILRMQVRLRSSKEARVFFESLPPDRLTIESYGREEPFSEFQPPHSG